MFTGAHGTNREKHYANEKGVCRSTLGSLNQTPCGSGCTFFLSEGGTVVTDTGAVSGSHENVVRLAADQVTQRAVGAGAVADEGLLVAGSCQSVARCICTGGPCDMSGAGAAEQLAGHVEGSARL